MWDTLIINPMINTLLWIYSLVGDFGIAIILFTILIRLLTYPLNLQQMKGQQVMQDMQKSKKYQDLQKKYKDDKQKLQQEQMKLYQEMGINPLAPCLPTLIQFPIIIGLYQAIIVVITTYLQSKLMTPAAAPGDGGGQAAQMTSAMNLYMPLFMGYLALTFASGL